MAVFAFRRAGGAGRQGLRQGSRRAALKRSLTARGRTETIRMASNARGALNNWGQTASNSPLGWSGDILGARISLALIRAGALLLVLQTGIGSTRLQPLRPSEG